MTSPDCIYIIENVFLAICVALLVVASAAGVYLAVLSSRETGMAEWVTDSYAALRSSELDTKNEFDVHMRDTRIGDVFTSFPTDDGAVMTAQSIAGEWDRFRIETTQPQFKHRATHSFVA